MPCLRFSPLLLFFSFLLFNTAARCGDFSAVDKATENFSAAIEDAKEFQDRRYRRDPSLDRVINEAEGQLQEGRRVVDQQKNRDLNAPTGKVDLKSHEAHKANISREIDLRDARKRELEQGCVIKPVMTSADLAKCR